jgi:hypothetical protein
MRRIVQATALAVIVIAVTGCGNTLRLTQIDELREHTSERNLVFNYQESIEVGPDTPDCTVMLDGEPAGVTPVTVEVEYGRLRVTQTITQETHDSGPVWQYLQVDDEDDWDFDPEEDERLIEEWPTDEYRSRPVGRWYTQLAVTGGRKHLLAVTTPDGSVHRWPLRANSRNAALRAAVVHTSFDSRGRTDKPVQGRTTIRLDDLPGTSGN